MQIGKLPESAIDQDLEVDSWKADHDKNGDFYETFEGKVKMKEANEPKYMGFVITNNASNAPNILDLKKEKSYWHPEKHHEHN